MKKIALGIVQRVYGSVLLFFGLNKIFGFMALPKHEGFAQVFLDAIDNALYIMPIIALVQITAGIALLSNRYVALALIVLFPISLNIFLFHLLHDRAALMPATIFMAWNTVLLFSRIQRYKTILAA